MSGHWVDANWTPSWKKVKGHCYLDVGGVDMRWVNVLCVDRQVEEWIRQWIVVNRLTSASHKLPKQLEWGQHLVWEKT